MRIELYCPRCVTRFAAPADAPGDQVLEQMITQQTWYALAGGATFEDMICTALLYRGAILCPDCRRPVLVREESLGTLIDTIGDFTKASDGVSLPRPAGRPRQPE